MRKEGWHILLYLPLHTATSHSRENHLAAVGRLVKVPAFVKMRRLCRTEEIRLQRCCSSTG
jgi:hypothetical protein